MSQYSGMWSTNPIPSHAHIRAMRGARQHPLLLDHVAGSEGAVDLLTLGFLGENYYHKERDNPPYHHRAPGSVPQLYVREGVAQRLLRIERLLRDFGYALYIHDAYRPVEVQSYFFEIYIPRMIQAEHPDWTIDRVENETRKYWSPSPRTFAEVDPLSPPPHATGGVIDVTLFDLTTGAVVDMGSPFDEVSIRSHPEYLELYPDRAHPRARDSRRMLYGAMRSEGFISHPNEWWHYGVGDQVSAFHSGEPYAVYGLMHIT